MQRSIVAGAVALSLLFGTRPASAQAGPRNFTLGVSAGASIPTGDFGDVANTGFEVGGLLQTRQRGGPLGFRAEVGYHRFGAKVGDGNARIVTALANGLYHLSTTSEAQPYLIAGGGLHNLGGSGGGDSQNKFGVNGGIGVALPLTGIAVDLEARFHAIFTDSRNTYMLPLSVNVRF